MDYINDIHMLSDLMDITDVYKSKCLHICTIAGSHAFPGFCSEQLVRISLSNFPHLWPAIPGKLEANLATHKLEVNHANHY